jgi:hypothetical protein
MGSFVSSRNCPVTVNSEVRGMGNEICQEGLLVARRNQKPERRTTVFDM